MLGTIMALSKFAIRIPLDIPGHSGIVWMTVLTVCCLSFKKGRAGTLAGVVAGGLAVLLGMGHEGILTFFKYSLPGFTMDMLFFLLPILRKRWYCVAITATFCHLTKLLVNYLAGLILNLPMSFLILGIKVAIISHFFFGFIAGLAGYLITNHTLFKNVSKILGEGGRQ